MAEVSSQREFGYALRHFIDGFNESPASELVAEEPHSLAETLHDEGVADAYLGAAAEWLCHRHHLPSPRWAVKESRILSRPFFAARSPGLRAILIQESPAEFRARNLFVSANALHRV
jgi:hypothetical protein